MLREKPRPKQSGQRIVDLYHQGLISKDMLMLYSVSGDMPDQFQYRGLTVAQKQEFWEKRMESRIGPEFRDILELPKAFIITPDTTYWLIEGF